MWGTYHWLNSNERINTMLLIFFIAGLIFQGFSFLLRSFFYLTGLVLGIYLKLLFNKESGLVVLPMSILAIFALVFVAA